MSNKAESIKRKMYTLGPTSVAFNLLISDVIKSMAIELSSELLNREIDETVKESKPIAIKSKSDDNNPKDTSPKYLRRLLFFKSESANLVPDNIEKYLLLFVNFTPFRNMIPLHAQGYTSE